MPDITVILKLLAAHPELFTPTNNVIVLLVCLISHIVIAITQRYPLGRPRRMSRSRTRQRRSRSSLHGSRPRWATRSKTRSGDRGKARSAGRLSDVQRKSAGKNRRPHRSSAKLISPRTKDKNRR